MAITGGPARDFKYGGMVLRPTKDGELEYESNGSDYEVEASPNSDFYSTAEAKVGFVSQECAFTVPEFNEFIKMKDGSSRAGTLTSPNGDVITINGIIDGEHTLSGGKCTVKISGKVRVQ
jgi:hypothetical protein